MDPIHVEEPATPEPAVPPAQTPEKDAVVSRVTDDAALVAHEAQHAAPTASDIAKVAQGAADGGLIGVVLAVVAVLGGGAAWKFYSQSSRQKAELAKEQAAQAHELAMAELNGRLAQPSTSPPPCILKHGEIDARLAAMDAKISRATSLDLPDDFDAEGLEARLAKVEKALKPATRTKR